LANATLIQRITALRLYFEYLVEEGLRPNSPVFRGGAITHGVDVLPLMFYMDPVTLKRKPCYTAEQTVTHEDLSSSSFKEHSLGRANQAAFFSSQGS